jgi:hypothetical protein
VSNGCRGRRDTLRVLILSVFALGTFSIAIASGQSPDTDASAIIASTREALGGETRLAAVKTFVITGRTRQVQGDNLVPIEFEISCELPDRCVRRDEVPARESGLTTSGFNGDELIQLPAPPVVPLPAGAPGRSGGPPQPNAQRVNTVKQDFARWWLGVLKDSHLPIMLSWQGQAQGKPIEYRLYYADYRDVDGVKLPFRLRRAIGADTVEETNIDRVRINTRIDARKFEVR